MPFIGLIARGISALGKVAAQQLSKRKIAGSLINGALNASDSLFGGNSEQEDQPQPVIINPLSFAKFFIGKGFGFNAAVFVVGAILIFFLYNLVSSTLNSPFPTNTQ